ncbi:transcription termination factor Rho [Gulosibacter hominis]|uniref:transcription termination factor Rho n=1 Tax=Gulosibacter hominis TaxID=2770504 RepID=UPI001917C5AB|nr:transcription termination factor Rho [Gulosibacter hominis]
MTEQNETQARPLNSMRVADLQALAAEMGIKGSARLRKSQLIEVIEQARGQSSPKAAAAAENQAAADDKTAEQSNADSKPSSARQPRRRVTVAPEAAAEKRDNNEADGRRGNQNEPGNADQSAADAKSAEKDSDKPADSGTKSADGGDQPRKKSKSNKSKKRNQNNNSDDDGAKGNESSSPKTLDDIVLPPARDDDSSGESEDADDDKQQEHSGNGRKRSRSRSRNRNDDSNQNQNQQRQRGRNRRDDADPEIAPDDVLLPIAGILDVLDNYAFVRTSGYLPGANDVYVSLGQVKKYGLRKGDAIVGAIRQPREGEHQGGRQKYNALAKIDTINGQTPEQIAKRPEFDSLTPLYPVDRLRLETAGGHAAQRMVDLFAPIGKGTRGIVVAPPKSGKSIMLERVASAVTQNEPDAHLMLVLVGERPEEVTRLQRMINGEVVSSTFDMPAENHTTIAELAIERAKRLVELGLDVVVLLDSLTQLCRAYNIAAPGSGRIIDGGVDASALHLPKTFFGAARNIENGGSLTILATAMVETGSRTDEVILEEFAGTANMELRLSRAMADKRIFPAVDIQQSSTLHEEDLLSETELAATWKIRRALGDDTQVSLESVLERLSSTATNEEFVAAVSREANLAVRA